MMWVLVLTCLIACTGKVVSTVCQIEMSPPRVVVKFGDSLSANCSSSASQIEGIGWESTYGGTGLVHGVSTLSLTIQSVKDWVIDPECYVNLNNGTQCVQPLPVTVYKMPDAVVVQPFIEVIEGKTYQLPCEIYSVAPARNLSVYWRKGNKIFHKETFDDPSPSPVTKLSLLNLTAHRDDNGVHFSCEPQLDLRPEEPDSLRMTPMAIKVTVLYPPTFRNPAHEMLEVPAGKEIALDCTATGNPMPTYRWTLPQSAEEMNKNQIVNESILKPSFQLPGTYSCTASNIHGNSTKYFSVSQAAGDRTTFAAIVGVFASLGVLLLIAGVFFVTKDGTFSCNKGSYIRGQPTSSGPV